MDENGRGRSAEPRRIRVLWLIKGLGPGGAETLLVSMAQAADHDTFDYHVAFVRDDKRHLVPKLEAAGVKVHFIGAATGGWPAGLLRLIQDLRPDVVHAHSPLLAVAARVICLTMPPGRRPVMLSTEHSQWSNHAPTTRMANALTNRWDDRRWAVSRDVRESMWPGQRHRVEVLVHGLSTGAADDNHTSREDVRATLGLGPDEVVAVTVANLRSPKDYPNLLSAAVQATAEEPALRFLAVGQGPLEFELRQLHRTLGLGDRFRFLGYRDDVPAILRASDIFVLGSRHEGLPVALLEAMAAGLPVVATRVGGVPEAVTHGVEALLTSPGDHEALANALVNLATDNRLRRTMGEASRRRAAAFDITHAAAVIEHAYLEREVAPTSTDDRARVLFVIPSLAQGGAERSLVEELPRLAERGIEPLVVCLHDRSPNFGGALVAAGIPIHVLTGPWHSRARGLTAIVKSWNPALIHTSVLEADLLGRFVGRHTDVPVVSTLVNTPRDPARLNDPHVNKFALRAYQSADAITAGWCVGHRALTDTVRRRAVSVMRLRQQDVVVIPRGRDMDALLVTPSRRAAARAALGIDEGAFVIGNVARHEYQKGVDLLVQAFAHVAETYPHAILLQAGRPGSHSAAIEAELRAAGLDGDRVRLLGHRDDVASGVLPALDLFVFPSRYEGLGGAVIEALGVGLPIVASDIPVLREVLGEAARYAPLNDSVALAGQIRSFVRNPTTTPVPVSVERAAHFDIDAVADQLYAWLVASATGRESYRGDLKAGRLGSPGRSTSSQLDRSADHPSTTEGLSLEGEGALPADVCATAPPLAP